MVAHRICVGTASTSWLYLEVRNLLSSRAKTRRVDYCTAMYAVVASSLYSSQSRSMCVVFSPVLCAAVFSASTLEQVNVLCLEELLCTQVMCGVFRRDSVHQLLAAVSVEDSVEHFFLSNCGQNAFAPFPTAPAASCGSNPTRVGRW